MRRAELLLSVPYLDFGSPWAAGGAWSLFSGRALERLTRDAPDAQDGAVEARLAHFVEASYGQDNHRLVPRPELLDVVELSNLVRKCLRYIENKI